MPRYTFECQNEDCSLRFERTLKMGDYTDYECPSCQELAPRVVVGFAFDFKVEGKTGNSGVHKDDYPTADHAVGRDAEVRWEHLKARDAVKKAVRARGEHPALMRRDGAGYTEYEVLGTPRHQVRKSLVQKAMEASQRARKK